MLGPRARYTIGRLMVAVAVFAAILAFALMLLLIRRDAIERSTDVKLTPISDGAY